VIEISCRRFRFCLQRNEDNYYSPLREKLIKRSTAESVARAGLSKSCHYFHSRRADRMSNSRFQVEFGSDDKSQSLPTRLLSSPTIGPISHCSRAGTPCTNAISHARHPSFGRRVRCVTTPTAWVVVDACHPGGP